MCLMISSWYLNLNGITCDCDNSDLRLAGQGGTEISSKMCNISSSGFG